MVKWKTRLELWNDGQKQVSRCIQIVRGFLQGDGDSPVGFCLTEVPVGKLLKASKGYREKKYKAYTQFIYRRPQDIPGEPQDVTNSK